MRTVSQKQQILNYLKQGNSLTQLEALNKFRCLRLAAVVNILRDNGYNIVTMMETNEQTGSRYARYVLR